MVVANAVMIHRRASMATTTLRDASLDVIARSNVASRIVIKLTISAHTTAAVPE